MVVLLANDYMEVSLAGLIADYDKETLANLYQPIIGYEALAVYFSLWSEAHNQKITSPCTHGQLFARMKIAPGTFLEARKRLEGIGLVQTYLDSSHGTNFYTYVLKAPKTPQDFFDNSLLFGLLFKALGENDANRLKNIYRREKKNDYGEDISSSFNETYHPDFNDQVFFKALTVPSSVDRVNSKITTDFSWEEFLKALKEISQISSEAFSKEDLKEIERLSLLNGNSEVDAANVVANIYNPHAKKGHHLDYSLLATSLQELTLYSPRSINHNTKNINSGKTELAMKINLMESVSPKQYLYCLQNGSQPAPSDLALVDDLNKKYHLTPSVINALLDYSLAVNKNILSPAFVEKTGAALAREGVKTAYDAMQYLKSIYRYRGNKDKAGKTIYNKKEKKPENIDNNIEENNENEPSWEEMMDMLKGGEEK